MTEQMRRRDEKLTLTDRIRENNAERMRDGAETCR